MILLLDVAAPGGGAIVAGAAIVFIIAITAIAYIAFRILRKTMKMAFRMAIIVAILIFALGGSIGLWWFASSKPAPRPTPQRPR